jgi:hypothetical protein
MEASFLDSVELVALLGAIVLTVAYLGQQVWTVVAPFFPERDFPERIVARVMIPVGHSRKIRGEPVNFLTIRRKIQK